jgi:DNA-binding transcriptional MerR regulator
MSLTVTRYLMSTGDVARALGVDPQTVRRMDGRLGPITTPSGHRRYDPAAVEKLLRERQRR